MQQSTILIESRPEMSNFLHGTFAVVFYVSLGKLCSIDIRYNLLCFLGRLTGIDNYIFNAFVYKSCM